MKHWAAPLIGKPWAPGADGPDAFSCWGLVRFVFKHRHGIDIPEIKLGDFGEAENVAALKRAATASGWKPVDDEPKVDDIVIMKGAEGRHVGVMIDTIRGLRLLHAKGHMGAKGPVGSVVSQLLKDVRESGYYDLETWRRAP